MTIAVSSNAPCVQVNVSRFSPVPGGGDQAGDRADREAVVDQEEHAAQAEEHAGRETLERDADVVKDVEPGHAGVHARLPALAEPLRVRLLHLLDALRREQIWSANARERIAPAKPSTPGSTNSAIASAKKRPWRRSVRGKSAAISSHTARIR